MIEVGADTVLRLSGRAADFVVLGENSSLEEIEFAPVDDSSAVPLLPNPNDLELLSPEELAALDDDDDDADDSGEQEASSDLE